jgi:hypothetical protein
MSLPDYVLKGTIKRAVALFKSLTADTGVFNTSITTPKVISSGINARSVATGITASTTQTRVGGTALTKAVNVVSTAANSGDAVTLPALTAGQSVAIYNDGANPIKVFPNGASDQIDAVSAGASVTLTNALRCEFTCTATNVIKSAKLGATST